MSKSIAISLSPQLKPHQDAVISLIDTHSHLFWDSYKKDLPAVIDRAVAAGVGKVINVGVNIELSKAATDQAKNESRTNFKICSSIAIHPQEAVKYFSAQPSAHSRQIDEDINTLEKI